MSDETHTGSLRFDWQNESSESFLKWLLPTLLVGHDNVGELSTATDNFTNVIITMQINGVEISTARFVDSLKVNYDYATRDAAREFIDEVLNTQRMENLIADLATSLRRGAYDLCARAGMKFETDEDGR